MAANPNGADRTLQPLDRDGGAGPGEFTSTMVALSGGDITRTVFARLLTAIGQPSSDVDAAFDALDRDRDGRISRDEYVAAWEDYLVSDDPDAAGARAFAGL
ncbi:MAG: EF-hand domain-containing protein [Kibdelosporangium sp.]